jgi:hypothetical protein
MSRRLLFSVAPWVSVARRDVFSEEPLQALTGLMSGAEIAFELLIMRLT